MANVIQVQPIQPSHPNPLGQQLVGGLMSKLLASKEQKDPTNQVELQGKTAQAGLEEFLNKDRPETVGAGQSQMVNPSEDVARAAATQPRNFLDEMLSQQPRQTKMEGNDLASMLDNQPEVGREVINQIPNPTPRETLPSGQKPEVYGDIAKKVLENKYAPKAPSVYMTLDAEGQLVGIPRAIGPTGITPPVKSPSVQMIPTKDESGNLSYTGVKKGVGETQAPEGKRFVLPGQEARVAGIREGAKFKFTKVFDPTLGRETQISANDLKNRLDQGNPPVTDTDAKRAQPALGALPEVYNTIQNTRDAAKQAIAATTSGKLGFDKSQLAQLAVLLESHKGGFDSKTLRNYMTGLVNAASDEPTRNYVNHLKTMYEALQPVRGLLGTKGAQSDMQYLALLDSAPGPTDVYFKDIEAKLQRLENTVALSTSSLPTVPGAHGYTIREINRDMLDRREGRPFTGSVLNGILNVVERGGQGAVSANSPMKVRRFDKLGNEIR